MYSLDSTVEVEVTKLTRGIFGESNFFVIVDDPVIVAKNVADIVPNHGGWAHMRDKCNQFVRWNNHYTFEKKLIVD